MRHPLFSRYVLTLHNKTKFLHFKSTLVLNSPLDREKKEERTEREGGGRIERIEETNRGKKMRV